MQTISDSKFSDIKRRCNVFFRGKIGLFHDEVRLPNRDALRITVTSGIGPFDEFDDDVIEEFTTKLEEDRTLEIVKVNKPKRDIRVFHLRLHLPK